MGLLTLPAGKNEFYDGANWYSLASENWVSNTIGANPPCLVATTATLVAAYAAGSAVSTPWIGATLTNSSTTKAAIGIDGVALILGSRVLVKDQTVPAQNGIYTVTTVGTAAAGSVAGTNWVLTRAVDFDSSSQMSQGDVVEVISGTTNAVSAWMLTSVVSIVGTSPITFSKLSQGGTTVSSIQGVTNQLVATTSTTGGVVTIGFASNPLIPGGAMGLPTGARPTTGLVAGMIRWNSGA